MSTGPPHAAPIYVLMAVSKLSRPVALSLALCLLGTFHGGFASPIPTKVHRGAEAGKLKLVMQNPNAAKCDKSERPKCVGATSTLVQGGERCGHGAVCPAGYRCTTHSANLTNTAGMGMRDLCEPVRCLGEYGEATRGGAFNLTCHEERIDGRLICDDQVRTRTKCNV